MSKKGLGGKLDAYVPPELRYDYKAPSMFAQYKVLTGVFLALGLGLLILWATAAKSPPPSPAQQEQPIYVEALPSK